MQNQHELTKNDILNTLNSSIGDARWLLAALKKNGEPLSKEQLKDEANELYKQQNQDKLIKSRHTHDVLAAKLEGAGVVNIKEYGRARFYEVSALGHELANYSRSK